MSDPVRFVHDPLHPQEGELVESGRCLAPPDSARKLVLAGVLAEISGRDQPRARPAGRAESLPGACASPRHAGLLPKLIGAGAVACVGIAAVLWISLPSAALSSRELSAAVAPRYARSGRVVPTAPSRRLAPSASASPQRAPAASHSHP